MLMYHNILQVANQVSGEMLLLPCERYERQCQFVVHLMAYCMYRCI